MLLMGGTTAQFSNTARTNTNEGENQKYNLQSSQVKHTRQDSINEFIIGKLNPLVVADFLKIHLCILAGITSHEFTCSDANSPAFNGELRFFASSPDLPLWYLNLQLFTSTINIEYRY